MNPRLFSIALLISALPAISSAHPEVSLGQEDFIAAEKASSDGETIIAVKLSKSGKAKFRKMRDVGLLTEADDAHKIFAAMIAKR